jgi:hypothetical protein
MDNNKPEPPEFITKKRVESAEDIYAELKKAQHESKVKAERSQLFIILWIGLGVMFSALSDKLSVMHWIIALIISGVYSFGFYKK